MTFVDKILSWCASDTPTARCTRTIAQGVIAAVITYIPDMISGSTMIPMEYKALTVALLMAVLSPIQASLGITENDGDDHE